MSGLYIYCIYVAFSEQMWCFTGNRLWYIYEIWTTVGIWIAWRHDRSRCKRRCVLADVNTHDAFKSNCQRVWVAFNYCEHNLIVKFLLICFLWISLVYEKTKENQTDSWNLGSHSTLRIKCVFYTEVILFSVFFFLPWALQSIYITLQGKIFFFFASLLLTL